MFLPPSIKRFCPGSCGAWCCLRGDGERRSDSCWSQPIGRRAADPQAIRGDDPLHLSPQPSSIARGSKSARVFQQTSTLFCYRMVSSTLLLRPPSIVLSVLAVAGCRLHVLAHRAPPREFALAPLALGAELAAETSAVQRDLSADRGEASFAVEISQCPCESCAA